MSGNSWFGRVATATTRASGRPLTFREAPE